MGLTPQEVSSLINGFLVGCLSDDLGLKATEALVVANADARSAVISGGAKLAFASTADIPDDATCQCVVSLRPLPLIAQSLARGRC